MKTFLSFCFLLAFIGLLIIGCSDKSMSPVQSSTTDNSVTLQKGSSVSGAQIIRYKDYYAWDFFDENTQLYLIVGINDLSNLCAEGGGYDVFNFKELYFPSSGQNLDRINEMIKGDDITATIWNKDSYPINFSDLCDFVLNNNPIAVGKVKLTYTDNDWSTYLRDHKNHDAFGLTANGSLTGQDGTVYNLNLVFRGVWDGVDMATYKEVLNIRLTPTGKK